MRIRNEQPGDASTIDSVIAAAFRDAPHSSGTEARIMDALRQADALTLSLVALDDAGGIIGQVAFSPVQIDRKAGRWFGLGPVAVLPAWQGCGFGQTLIRSGLDQLAVQGAAGCVLLGDPAYYGRLGFISDAALTYQGEASPYLQYLVLAGDAPRGDVSYHPAFDVA